MLCTKLLSLFKSIQVKIKKGLLMKEYSSYLSIVEGPPENILFQSLLTGKEVEFEFRDEKDNRGGFMVSITSIEVADHRGNWIIKGYVPSFSKEFHGTYCPEKTPPLKGTLYFN